MSRLISMSGKEIGRWTVVRESGRDNFGQALWLCRCECGTESLIPGGRLRRGDSVSCGCGKPAACAAANTKHGDSAGGRMTAEYRAWSNMIDRCERPTNPQYKDWGGRGIAVCPRWRESFAAFLTDMGRRTAPDHSIDRIDNDGNYEPGNCRWATREDQAGNKRTTLKLNGVRVIDIARKTGVKYHSLRARLVKSGRLDAREPTRRVP